MLFESLPRRAIWNEMLYQSLEQRELWLHIALERQVARGMAWLDAWGPYRWTGSPTIRKPMKLIGGRVRSTQMLPKRN